MKTIDVLAKRWRDKVYGNTYFSARVIIDYGMEGERVYYVPYEYGYGEQYLYSSFDRLFELGLVPKDWTTCPTMKTRENGVILRHGIQAALKKDIIAWGKP